MSNQAMNLLHNWNSDSDSNTDDDSDYADSSLSYNNNSDSDKTSENSNFSEAHSDGDDTHDTPSSSAHGSNSWKGKHYKCSKQKVKRCHQITEWFDQLII